MIGMWMKALTPMVVAIAATCAITVEAHASPTTYKFSGSLWQVGQNSNPEWAFAVGQTFRGQLVYDVAAITSSYDYIDQPDFKLRFHNSPLVSLSYEIDTPNGTFAYSPPAKFSTANIGVADDSNVWWTGADLRWLNYPIAGEPGVAVPDSGYIGAWYAHSSFISLLDYNSRPLDSTDADVDLVALFDALPAFSRQFSVRFSDPTKWEGFNERIDDVIYGQITSFAVAGSAVPEPATWAMMLLGFGMIGGASRYDRKRTKVVYA